MAAIHVLLAGAVAPGTTEPKSTTVFVVQLSTHWTLQTAPAPIAMNPK
jgi:hypothetical protein